MSEELRACPWGHDAAVVSTDDIELNVVHVVCRTCGSAGPTVSLDDFDTIALARSEAAHLWNDRRTPTAEPMAGVSPGREDIARAIDGVSTTRKGGSVCIAPRGMLIDAILSLLSKHGEGDNG